MGRTRTDGAWALSLDAKWPALLLLLSSSSSAVVSSSRVPCAGVLHITKDWVMYVAVVVVVVVVTRKEIRNKV